MSFLESNILLPVEMLVDFSLDASPVHKTMDKLCIIFFGFFPVDTVDNLFRFDNKLSTEKINRIYLV